MKAKINWRYGSRVFYNVPMCRMNSRCCVCMFVQELGGSLDRATVSWKYWKRVLNNLFLGGKQIQRIVVYSTDTKNFIKQNTGEICMCVWVCVCVCVVYECARTCMCVWVCAYSIFIIIIKIYILINNVKKYIEIVSTPRTKKSTTCGAQTKKSTTHGARTKSIALLAWFRRKNTQLDKYLQILALFIMFL